MKNYKFSGSKFLISASLIIAGVSSVALATEASKPLDISCAGSPSSHVIYQLVHLNTPADAKLIIFAIDKKNPLKWKVVRQTKLAFQPIADSVDSEGNAMINFKAVSQGTVEGPGWVGVSLRKNLSEVYYSVPGRLRQYDPGIAQEDVDLHCDPN